MLEAQEESEQRHQETQRLHQTINTVKTNSQRQIDELQVSCYEDIKKGSYGISSLAGIIL